MARLILEAGPLLWPILLFGVLAIGAAARYSAVGGSTLRRFSIYMTSTALALGVLSTVAGLWKALGPISLLAEDQRWIILLGLKESLNGLIVALVVAVLVAIALGIGSLRFEHRVQSGMASVTAKS